MTKKKTLYEELEVSPLSNKAQIKNAYRTKVKKVHPDRGGDPEEFKRVVTAYLILSDDESRYKYDSQGEEEKPSDRKPIDIGKQAENFLVRTVFDIVDRHGDNLPNRNMQKLLIEVFDNFNKFSLSLFDNLLLDTKYTN
jgi:curved DNA-binding protein CbpA